MDKRFQTHDIIWEIDSDVEEWHKFGFACCHICCCSVTQSCPTLQHAGLPCLSPSPGACSNSCPLSQWWHPTISSSVIPFCSCLQSFPRIRVFSNELVLHMKWPKYWSFSFSFSISPSNEYSGLIALGFTGWSPCSPRDSQESFPTPHKGINSSALCLL